MATGTILLPIGGVALPDGSANNAFPELKLMAGTETAPSKRLLVLGFDPATPEYAWWSFQLPLSYGGTPVVRLLWMAEPTSATSVVWSARIGAIGSGDVDTPLSHPAAAASSATASTNVLGSRRLVSTSIPLASSDDAAPGDLAVVTVFRNAAHGSDTLDRDAELVSASLEYAIA